jgi:hypothetical protein
MQATIRTVTGPDATLAFLVDGILSGTQRLALFARMPERFRRNDALAKRARVTSAWCDPARVPKIEEVAA